MDCKDQYNKTLFLETIKTGRTPKRSGLGTRLYLLAGFTNIVYTTCKRNLKVKNYNSSKLQHVSVNGLTNRIEFSRNFYNPYYKHDVVSNLKSAKMHGVLERFLGEYYFETRIAYAFVYFKPDVEINWGELDHDLRIKYPNKTRVDKRGFVYYKD